MRVKFIGGPFNGTTKDCLVDDRGRPLPCFNFYPLQPVKRICDGAGPNDEEVKVDRYKLEEIYRDGRLSHYEYHYVGR